MSYTIKILNNSGHDHPYVVFMPPSQTQATNEPAMPVYNNAWVTFQNITDGAWDGGPYTGPAAFQVSACADGKPIGAAAHVDFNSRRETAVDLIHTQDGWTVTYR